jgi:hypothetical protein
MAPPSARWATPGAPRSGSCGRSGWRTRGRAPAAPRCRNRRPSRHGSPGRRPPLGWGCHGPPRSRCPGGREPGGGSDGSARRRTLRRCGGTPAARAGRRGAATRPRRRSSRRGPPGGTGKPPACGRPPRTAHPARGPRGRFRQAGPSARRRCGSRRPAGCPERSPPSRRRCGPPGCPRCAPAPRGGLRRRRSAAPGTGRSEPCRPAPRCRRAPGPLPPRRPGGRHGRRRTACDPRRWPAPRCGSTRWRWRSGSAAPARDEPAAGPASAGSRAAACALPRR